jgi:hypothetical protein
MNTHEATVRIKRSGSDRSVELAIRGARRETCKRMKSMIRLL